MTPSFENLSTLSTRVVATEANHTKAAAALAAAHAAREGVAARLADIAAKRQEVIARRAEGDLRDTDGETLSLLDADAEGLQLVLGRHDGILGEAEGPVRAAADAAAMAKLELQRAELRATEAALLGRVVEIEKALIEAGRGLRATRNALGGGMLAWVPSDDLMAVIVPARGQRHW